ncbi:unnamed protein product [Nippostrongylus brasiliensis]|uniref:Mediator of RNA polymerase II transcription subunit 7 n=1 Tax=Nippostrongylus brasiliensis TaxID=27835 RepID=A0A0N4Y238_NIPBR|nr:unnamed protein product [Nippostrongylus brasiliensis]
MYSRISCSDQATFIAKIVDQVRINPVGLNGLLDENIEVDEEVPIGTEVQVVTYESTDSWQPPEEEDDGRVGSVHDMDGPFTREMMAAAETKLSVLKLELFALSKGSSREDREDMEKVIALLDNVISVVSDAVKKRHAKQQEALARRSELAAEFALDLEKILYEFQQEELKKTVEKKVDTVDKIDGGRGRVAV